MTDQRFIAEGCSPMRMLAVLFALLAVNLASALARQEDASAAPAAGRFRVQLRYAIDATGAQRYQRYQTFLKRLAAAGFQKEKGLEGEELHGFEMVGSLPASALPALLNDPYVRTALLHPEGATLPEDQPLLVRLYVTPDLGVARQKETADRVREQLKALGFQENTGADTQGQTQLLGRLPLAQLKQLLTNKFDVPVVAKTEPGHPVFKTALVKAAVVLAEPEGFKPLPEPAATADKPGKVSPALAKQAAEAGDKPVRVEVLLRQAPSARDTLANLQGMGLAVDGRLGANVYGTIPGKFVADLAALPEVSLVRLPEAARTFGAGGFLFVPLGREAQPAVDPAAWVRRQGPNKAVVIASDFTGWEQQKGKTLPAKTTLVDLTAELTSGMDPAAAAEGTGEGTKLAEQLVKQGGIEDLILARIDPAAPWQVAAIAAAVNGHPWLTPALAQRLAELRSEQIRLEDERKVLRVKRRIALDNFGIDENSKAARDKYRQEQAAFDAAEAKIKVKGQRLMQLQKFAQDFKGANTVLLGLAWPDGYADLPGGLPTLRGLSADDLAAASWLQAIPLRTGAVWHGLFNDQAADRLLRFGPGGANRPDLNFLAFAPKDGKPTQTLPAGLELLARLQWQEPHDRRLMAEAGDLFREPRTQFRMVLLRQRDPSGKNVPADVFDVVARGSAVAERIENGSGDAIYELRLPFTVAQPGRYALLVEGATGAAPLPGPRGEVRPKLTVEAIDATHRAKGTLRLESFTGE